VPQTTPSKRASLKRKALKAYRLAGNLSETARQVGVDRNTLQDWRVKDPEFAQALEDIDNETVDAVESTLVQMALEKDIVAIKYYLTNRSKRYASKPEGATNGALIQQQFIVRMEQPPQLPVTIAHPSIQILSSNPGEESEEEA